MNRVDKGAFLDRSVFTQQYRIQGVFIRNIEDDIYLVFRQPVYFHFNIIDGICLVQIFHTFSYTLITEKVPFFKRKEQLVFACFFYIRFVVEFKMDFTDLQLVQIISMNITGKKEYYNNLGWDERGIPTKKTLKYLNLKELDKVLKIFR